MAGFGHPESSSGISGGLLSWTGTGHYADVMKHSYLELVTEHDNTTIFGSKGNCSRFVLFSAEKEWGYQGRAFLYCLILLYCFVGMAVITTVFMRALETIVRQTRVVRRTDPVTNVTQIIREKIWNPAIADITLLALGTSAPPIAISIIDAFQQLGKTDGGGLGPGTIVGSAAFNVFPIYAVIVLVPKNGTVKKIADFGVHLVELLWSIWAYIWLLIILQFSSKGSVTVWEAIFTVLQFPVLMLHAYAQDKGWPYIAMPFKSEKLNAAPTQMSSELSRLESGHDARSPGASPFQPAAELDQKKPGWLGQSDLMGVDHKTPFQRLSYTGESGQVDGMVNSPSYARQANANGREDEPHTWGDIWKMWGHQFSDAVKVNGADHGTVNKGSSLRHGLMHYVSLPWKLLFACNPPPSLAHGWVTFVCAIVCIIGLSVVVIKVVHVLGCVTGISSFVLAITVLAAGTSWPDLVACKIAVEDSATADSAVANINASNSINIYLGMGIPWLIQVFHSQIAYHKNFRTPSNGVSFSVVVYFVCFTLCLVVLNVRRLWFGGELGGPRGWAWASSFYFFSLWALFIILSCLNDYGKL